MPQTRAMEKHSEGPPSGKKYEQKLEDDSEEVESAKEEDTQEEDSSAEMEHSFDMNSKDTQVWF